MPCIKSIIVRQLAASERIINNMCVTIYSLAACDRVYYYELHCNSMDCKQQIQAVLDLDQWLSSVPRLNTTLHLYRRWMDTWSDKEMTLTTQKGACMCVYIYMYCIILTMHVQCKVCASENILSVFLLVSIILLVFIISCQAQLEK